MIRRMADRLGHLGQHAHSNSKRDEDAFDPGMPMPMPMGMGGVTTGVAAFLSGHGHGGYDHRGSISTQATSVSEWSSAGADNNVHNHLKRVGSDMDMVVEEDGVDALGRVQAPGGQRAKLVRRPRGVYRLSDFIIQRTLGTGSFGRVHLVRSKHNLRFYAIKVLNKDRVVKMKQVEHTNNEQRMLECVQHPFIINLWGYFQDTANLYMVMDFVPGGELFTLLRRSNRFPDPVAKFYAAEVGLALNHLHGLGIIYRDLKPENVLLNADGHIKVADFGFAKAVDTTTWTLCGTPDYLAPEVIGQQRYNKSVDWYALGILIYEMLFGLPPYHQTEQNHLVLYDRIQAGPSKVAFPPAAFSDGARDLIMKLMETDPSKRYGNMRHGAGDVFAHAWFREVDWERLEGREITAPYLPRIAGDGDASAFERYPEEGGAEGYGVVTEDRNGGLFPDFEYTGTG
ncbi:kinase-like domain-containing protein [Mycena alexandri]|uniref:cAMP-dependent protein kinase n=1 Tax=Mycena alexandri TaxID=1745969 RepID=A0AAD6STX4_9AGAR|nr:kinase-like domain-containing protein [Mycena alexandri]